MVLFLIFHGYKLKKSLRKVSIFKINQTYLLQTEIHRDYYCSTIYFHHCWIGSVGYLVCLITRYVSRACWYLVDMFFISTRNRFVFYLVTRVKNMFWLLHVQCITLTRVMHRSGRVFSDMRICYVCNINMLTSLHALHLYNKKYCVWRYIII